MRKWPVVVVVAFPTLAFAESPITLVAGVGLTVHSSEYYETQVGTASPSLHLDVGYRLPRGFAIGVHGDLSSFSGYFIDDLHIYPGKLPFSYVPLNVGVQVQYAISDRVWIAAWGGKHIFRYHDQFETKWTNGPPSLGATIGGDVIVRGANRVTVFAGVSHASSDDYEYDSPLYYTGITFGLGYRL